jgi:hypothetical protein
VTGPLDLPDTRPPPKPTRVKLDAIAATVRHGSADDAHRNTWCPMIQNPAAPSAMNDSRHSTADQSSAGVVVWCGLLWQPSVVKKKSKAPRFAGTGPLTMPLDHFLLDLAAPDFLPRNTAKLNAVRTGDQQSDQHGAEPQSTLSNGGCVTTGAWSGHGQWSLYNHEPPLPPLVACSPPPSGRTRPCRWRWRRRSRPPRSWSRGGRPCGTGAPRSPSGWDTDTPGTYAGAPPHSRSGRTLASLTLVLVLDRLDSTL